MGIKDEVKRLVNTESAAHKRLIEYVVRQLRAGRSLDAVLRGSVRHQPARTG